MDTRPSIPPPPACLHAPLRCGIRIISPQENQPFPPDPDYPDMGAGGKLAPVLISMALLLGACTTSPNRDPDTILSDKQAPQAAYRETKLAAVTPLPPPQPDIKQEIVISKSVWEQLRSNFRLPLPHASRLDTHLQAYRDNPWAVESLLERSTPYLAWIAQETEKQGVPGEIALLPAVESGFDPLAHSPGDAAGLWQFIPATGRRFGLTQNWWYDARRDIVISTRAALKYLKYLRKRFDGDWLLALAAYNTGEGKIRAAIKSNLDAGRPTDFWYLDLPQETRDYVPRLLALRLVVEHPKRYGVNLPDINAQPAFAVTNADGQIDLSVAAQLAGLPLDELVLLNAGYKHGATPPKGPHRIVLPVDRITGFQAELNELAPERRVQWLRHQVQSGETLSHIALRYQTSVAALRHINGLDSDRIKAGARLVIPGAEPSDRNSSPTHGTARTPWWRKTRKVVHGVRRGDTLWDLARYYGVSVRQLATWNDISIKDYLQPGQKLVLHMR